MPILEVLRTHPKEVLLAMGARCAENGAFYIYSVFMLVYATQHSHIDRNVALNGLIAGVGVRVHRDSRCTARCRIASAAVRYTCSAP